MPRREEIIANYVGDTESQPHTWSDGTPTNDMIKNLAVGLAQVMGARAATVPIGGVPAGETSAPVSQAKEVTVYDDRTERPNMTWKDRLIQGLIPIGTALAGGFLGGNTGAMDGAISGLKAIKDDEDYSRNRWDKVEDAKRANRSSVMTAKILRDLGGKDGGTGGGVKQNWVLARRTNPQTNLPEYVLQNRVTGELKPTGMEAWDTNARWRFYRANPDVKPDDVDESSAEAQKPKPGIKKGDVGFGLIRGLDLNPDGAPKPAPGKPNAGKTGSVVSNEMAPIDLKTPTTPAPSQEPSEDQPNSPETARDQALQSIQEDMDANARDLEEAKKKLGAAPRDGETSYEADARDKAARKEIDRLVDEERDLKKERRAWDVRLDQQQAQILLEDRRAKNRARRGRGGSGGGTGTASEDGGGAGLKPNETGHFSEAKGVMEQLSGVKKVIDKYKDVMGPISGRARGLNPYDTQARDMDSDLKIVSQVVGKYLEGGKLMKEDERKYRDLLPNLNDSPEVARLKLKNVKKAVRTKHETEINALKAQGFDVSGLELPPDQDDDGDAIKASKDEAKRGLGKTVVKKEHHKGQNKTRFTYSDGSSEVVDGLQ